MKNLKELNASEKCGIEGLNLIKLNVCNNSKIKDVSFMNNLKKLVDSCRIDQIGIKGLNLIEYLE